MDDADAVVVDETGRVTVRLSLAQVEAAVSRSWSAETTYASAEYLARAPLRRSRGQCGPTALVVNDLLGGELLVADLLADGVRLGVHYWNRLPDGSEVDLTGDQLLDDETLHDIRVVVRPGGPVPAAGRDAYLLLRERVLRDLQASQAGPILATVSRDEGGRERPGVPAEQPAAPRTP